MLGHRCNRSAWLALPLVTAAILYFGLSATAGAGESDTALARRALLGAGVDQADGGVKVTFLRAGGAAEIAGFRVGDVVTAIGGRPVSTVAEFLAVVKSTPTGKRTAFDIRRGEAPLVLQPVLTAVPDEQDAHVLTQYRSISVDGSLRRTLITAPIDTTGKRPAMLIIGGIGCYSVDNATDSDDTYLRLSHDVSRRGFIVMRLEKSGVGDSQGPACLTVDFRDEMHSYEVALESLRRDPRVDSKRLYLLGHSIGSAMAPRFANERPVAGVIMLDGIGRNWFEYELLNLRRQLELGGERPEKVDALIAEKELCMHRLLVVREAESEIEKTQPECRQHNMYPASAAYVQQAAALNFAEPWTRLSVPLLAIYGSADFITTEDDHRRIVSIVNASHPGLAVLRIVPGMDHHLDAAGTPQAAYDLRVRQHTVEHYDVGLSAAVLEWLCEREVCLCSDRSRFSLEQEISRAVPSSACTIPSPMKRPHRWGNPRWLSISRVFVPNWLSVMSTMENSQGCQLPACQA